MATSLAGEGLAVTRAALLGEQAGLAAPDAVLVVLDAGNLAHQLRFALELIELGKPMVVALNMIDLAERDGLTLAPERLADATAFGQKALLLFFPQKGGWQLLGIRFLPGKQPPPRPQVGAPILRRPFPETGQLLETGQRRAGQNFPQRPPQQGGRFCWARSRNTWPGFFRRWPESRFQRH